MKKWKQITRQIPYWAFLLVLVVAVVNTLYFIYKDKMPVDGLSKTYVNGQWTIDYVTPNGPAEKAGILPGDFLVSVDKKDIDAWDKYYLGVKAGDTFIYGIVRNGQELTFSITMVSPVSFSYVFFLIMHILLFLLSCASLYLLYKKPDDAAARLFFIYLQIFVVTQNATYLMIPYSLAIAATFIFTLCCGFLGPVLIHFHLLFPKPSKIYVRFKIVPKIFYFFGLLFFILYFIAYFLTVKGLIFYSTFHHVNRIVLSWLTLTYFLAIVTVVYQFITIKDTLSRNQLRIVIIGSFFGLYTGMAIALFYDQLYYLQAQYPTLIMIFQGAGGMVTVVCILIAIFRYRIWNTEIFIKKTLLYLSATFVIAFSYFLLVYLIDFLTISKTNLMRFITLAFSIFVFLIIRDWVQKIIDRVFHREDYDSATVVSDFEEKLSGIYKFDELKSAIANGLDEIFHFKIFVFNLKKSELIYEPAFVMGMDGHPFIKDFEVNPELENFLRKPKIFSPDELNKKPASLEIFNGELIVPLLAGDQIYGFFICGQKQSEKTYSLQDFRVLSLLAHRVISLLNTAKLYQKDIDQQLLLERERTRISQDMHDDVGASLTRISILSELAKNQTEISGESKQWLGQISETSRDVMEEMNQIIWALNPKNNTLEGLIAYMRRFANEFLEPTSISCSFDLPVVLPDMALSVEIRRNIYLVIRESLHNVVKHANASKVWLSLKINEHEYQVKIKDNGKGFNPKNVKFPGNGLINMKKRMKDIGGSFQIQSNNSDGTQITLIISLK